MKTVTLLRARVMEMSAAEAAAVVGPRALAEVRRRDERAMFVELIAGHEGVSTGSLVGGSTGRGRSAKKSWGRGAVSELAARLTPGTPVFTGHGGDGRRPVGRVLAAVGRVVSGVLTAVGVAWISAPDVQARLRRGELDACSVEAEVELQRKPGDETWVVGAVRRVTGVALGDRRRERPGFTGASVRVIEEFEGEGVGGERGRAGEGGSSSDPLPAPEAAHDVASDLSAELKAVRAELRQLREELKRSTRSAGVQGRLSLPPEPARPERNPLIPR